MNNVIKLFGVKRPPSNVRYEEIKVGEHFLYSGECYVKISVIELRKILNVSIHTGETVILRGDTPVTPVCIHEIRYEIKGEV